MDQINDKFNIILDDSTKVLEIRTGEALPLKEPKSVQINGTIDAPKRYLDKRKGEIDLKICHISVDKNEMRIALVVFEENFYGPEVSGTLKINPEYKAWNINASGFERSPHDLAEFIKMNRYFFESKQVAMELVNDLMNFEAKVNKEIEDKTDNRANITQKRHQVVKSNIPDKFKLKIPIFVGQDPEAFDVEVNINASSFQCSLVSPDANDIIKEVRDKIIDAEIKEIESLVPELLIVYV